ncbi:MAG: hypothetical protein ACK4EY_01210 [Flavipsychrobacter sp.]
MLGKMNEYSDSIEDIINRKPSLIIRYGIGLIFVFIVIVHIGMYFFYDVEKTQFVGEIDRNRQVIRINPTKVLNPDLCLNGKMNIFLGKKKLNYSIDTTYSKMTILIPLTTLNIQVQDTQSVNVTIVTKERLLYKIYKKINLKKI